MLQFGVPSFSNSIRDYIVTRKETHRDGHYTQFDWVCDCLHYEHRGPVICKHISKAKRQFAKGIVNGIDNQICLDEIFTFVPFPNDISTSFFLSCDVRDNLVIWEIAFPEKMYVKDKPGLIYDLIKMGIPRKIVRRHIVFNYLPII